MAGLPPNFLAALPPNVRKFMEFNSNALAKAGLKDPLAEALAGRNVLNSIPASKGGYVNKPAYESKPLDISAKPSDPNYNPEAILAISEHKAPPAPEGNYEVVGGTKPINKADTTPISPNTPKPWEKEEPTVILNPYNPNNPPAPPKTDTAKVEEQYGRELTEGEKGVISGLEDTLGPNDPLVDQYIEMNDPQNVQRREEGLNPNDPSYTLANLLSAQKKRNEEFFFPLEDQLAASANQRNILAQARETLSDGHDKIVGRYDRDRERYGLNYSKAATQQAAREHALSKGLNAATTLNNARVAETDRKDNLLTQLLNNSRSLTGQSLSGISNTAGLQSQRNSTANTILNNAEINAINSQANSYANNLGLAAGGIGAAAGLAAFFL